MRTRYRRRGPFTMGRRVPRSQHIAAVSGSMPEPEKKRGLSRFAEVCSALRTILSLILIVIILIAVGVIFFREYTRKVVLIDSFNVTTDLQNRGLTSSVIAAKIADEIDLMRRSAIQDVKTTRFAPVFSESFPDVMIPEAHVSLKSILQYAREVFSNSPTRIGGEAMIADNKLHLTVRVIRNRDGV